jgi:hypothetical protein
VQRGLDNPETHPLIEDAKAMGASPAQLEKLRGSIERQRPPPPVIWPQHWHAWRVFVGMGSQWRTKERAGGVLLYEGLDYAALPVVLDEHRRLPRRYRQPLARLMPQLRTLEHAAREVLNESD